MVAAVAVEARQRAKRNKAMAEEEGKTPPLPLAVRRPRQPTPDHPPYCWMIGEAIDALGEHGGSAEDEISSFIRTRHPGVPAAHDRFLRHYLARHVAEGFFVCTAPGRYARSLFEAAATAAEAPVELAVAGPFEATRVESPVVQVKRGRGRPRKDGSSSTPTAVKKDGNAGSVPRRYARSPSEAAAMEATVEPLVASPSETARFQPPAVQVKRGRGRPRKDGSSSTPPAIKKDGNAGSAPGRYARRFSEAVAGPPEAVRVEPPVLQIKRGRGRPRKVGSSSTPPAVKKDGKAGSAPHKCRGRPRGVAQLAAGGGSVPSSSVADKNGSQATASAPRRRRRLRKLATNIYVSGEALVTDTKEDRIAAPSTKGKERGRSLELTMVVVGDGSATTPTVDDNVCGKTPPSMLVDSDQPCELALVTTTDVAAGDGPVSVLVADKTGANETPSGKNKRRLRQPRQAFSMVIAAQGSVPASAAGKKARGNTLSATPKAKGRRQGKLALVATQHSAPTSVTGKKEGNVGEIATLKLTPVTPRGCNGAPSAAHGQPSRLCPVTAGGIPDDPSWCLLALPAVARS